MKLHHSSSIEEIGYCEDVQLQIIEFLTMGLKEKAPCPVTLP
jgi:hypothetical protein